MFAYRNNSVMFIDFAGMLITEETAGHMTVYLYDANGNLVTDPRDVGTYNFCPSGAFLGRWGHRLIDVLPRFIFGNDDDDPGPLINEIINVLSRN